MARREHPFNDAVRELVEEHRERLKDSRKSTELPFGKKMVSPARFRQMMGGGSEEYRQQMIDEYGVKEVAKMLRVRRNA